MARPRKKSNIRTPPGQTLRRWTRRGAPLAVWLIAASAAGVLMLRRTTPFEIVGIAEPEQREIAAVGSGRLADVSVGVFDWVEAGQIVASIEDAAIVAQLATARSEAERLNSRIRAERTRLSERAMARVADRLDDRRRFARDVEQYESEILSIQTDLEADRVRLERQRRETERIASLVESEALGQQVLDDIGLRHDETARTIEENERLIAQNRKNLGAAQARVAEFDRGEVADVSLEMVVEPLELQFTVQQRRIDELEVARLGLMLRSPISGRVAQVLRRPGEAVRTGDPILVVTAPDTARVVAYLTPDQASRLVENAEVIIERRTAAREAAVSRVARIGPALEPIPERLWTVPGMPQWGQPAVIPVVEPLRLVPGEVVGIRLAVADANDLSWSSLPGLNWFSGADTDSNAR